MAVSLEPNSFWNSFGWMNRTTPLELAEWTDERKVRHYLNRNLNFEWHEVEFGRYTERMNFAINHLKHRLENFVVNFNGPFCLLICSLIDGNKRPELRPSV
jgi:hypothetical protein